MRKAQFITNLATEINNIKGGINARKEHNKRLSQDLRDLRKQRQCLLRNSCSTKYIDKAAKTVRDELAFSVNIVANLKSALGEKTELLYELKGDNNECEV